MFKQIVCVMLSLPFTVYASEKYKLNRPIFYAAMAKASYIGHKDGSQSSMDAIAGYGQATVVAHKEHKSALFGKTTFIGLKDRHGNFHVAIEGTNNGHNWLGNAVAPVNGMVHRYDVPEETRKSMRKLIKKLTKTYGALVSLVGHSQGGMFASQVGRSFDEFKNTQIITFNGYKIKSGKNQLHLAIGNEEFATLCSPSHRYRFLPYGGGKLAIGPNHSMKHFINGLQHKEWPDILPKK